MGILANLQCSSRLRELELLKAQYVQKDNMCVEVQTASAVLTEVNVQKFSALLILYLVVLLLCCIAYAGILIYRGYRYHREAHAAHLSPPHDEEEEDEEADDQQLLRRHRCFGLSCGSGGDSVSSYKIGKGGKNRLDMDDNGGIDGDTNYDGRNYDGRNYDGRDNDGRDNDGRARVGGEGGGFIVGYVDDAGCSSNPFSRVSATSTSFGGSSSCSSTITTTTVAAAAAAAATAQTIKSSAGFLPFSEPPPTAPHPASSPRTDPPPTPGTGTSSPSGAAIPDDTSLCLGGPVWPDPSIAVVSAASVGVSRQGSKHVAEWLDPLLEEGNEAGEEEKDVELGGGVDEDRVQCAAAAASEVVAGGAVAAGVATSGLSVAMSTGIIGEAAGEREAAAEGGTNTEAEAEPDEESKRTGSAITTTTAAAVAGPAAASAAASSVATLANAPTTDHGTSRLIPGLPPVNFGSTSILSSMGDAAANLPPKLTTTAANSTSNLPPTDALAAAPVATGMPSVGSVTSVILGLVSVQRMIESSQEAVQRTMDDLLDKFNK
ncbi:unnamed protein product, partial [Closterium sp. NIES-54]